MTSLPPFRRVWPCLILTLLFAAGASAQSEEDFREKLEAAHAQGDLGPLIEANRLEVKPAVYALITQILEAELAGEHAEAAAKKDVAATIASTFEQRFGEKGLSEGVSYLDEWSLEEKRAKLRADSMLALGRELRTGDEAHRAYLDALAAYREIRDRLGVAETLGGLGVVHWYKDNGDSTVAYFERALEARRAVDDRELIGNSLFDMGLASRGLLGDNRSALEYFRKSAEMREEIGAASALVRTNYLLGVVYGELGMYQKSVDHHDQAAEQAMQAGDSSIAARALYRGGVARSNTGRYAEALDRLQRSLELRKEGDPEIASVLDQIGVVYRRLGDYEAAIAKYQDVIQLVEAASDSTLLAITLTNAGVVLQWAHRFEQASGYFKRALAIVDRLNDERGRIDPLINLGSVNQDLEHFDASEPHLQEALALSRKYEDPVREGRALVLLGNLYNLTGRPDEAGLYYQQGIELARESEIPELEWAALMGFGERLERQGDFEKAVDAYLQALETAELLRSGLQFGDDKARFLAQKRFAYENVVHLLGLLHEEDPDLGYDRRAFTLSERGKARAFLDLLGEAVAEAEDDLDPVLLAEEESLLDEIGQTQRSLQVASAADQADTHTADSLRSVLDGLEEEYQQLQRDIRSQSPSYAGLSYPDLAGVADVQQQLLDENTVLLQYALGDSSSSLWAISTTEAQMYRLPARDDLQEQVEVLRFALTNPDGASAESFAAPARRLYQNLLSPAEEFIRDGQDIMIVPDDVLHYVPFEALLTREAPSGSFAQMPYLAKRNATSYGHSASVLLQLKRDETEPKVFPKQFLAFGDPDFGDLESAPQVDIAVSDVRAGLSRLPYSGVEVQTISGVFGDANADVYLRKHALEDRLKEEGRLQRYRYIHFATHGIVDERRPDFSGVVLAQADGSEDGYLQAAEIFNLKIDADLVVLSACETGLGEMVRGEGLVGLTRAFMYAGASSIVVSLWKVADASTSTLMQHFYRSMIDDGRSKAEALQQAKIKMMEGNSAHPFHWAPFVIVGNRN